MESDWLSGELEQHVSAARWYVYMIRADDRSLYTGVTTNVERRLAEHKAEASGPYRGARALRGKRHLKLVYSFAATDQSQALKLEYAIKQLRKARKEALVAGRLPIEELLAGDTKHGEN